MKKIKPVESIKIKIKPKTKTKLSLTTFCLLIRVGLRSKLLRKTNVMKVAQKAI